MEALSAVAAIVATEAQITWLAPTRSSTYPPPRLAAMKVTEPHSRTGP